MKGDGSASSTGLLSWVHGNTAVCEEASKTGVDSNGLTPEQQPPPAMYDDPEYNATVLERWRACIGEARKAFANKNLEGAEASLKEALEVAMHFGHASGPVATSLLNLAQLYRRVGRYSEAEPLLQRAADSLEQNAGPNNKVTLLALLDLATTRFEMGQVQKAATDFDDAIRRFDRAIEFQKHARDYLQGALASCLVSSSKAEAALGNKEKAEAQLRRSVELTELRWGLSTPRLVAPRAELAKLLLSVSRAPEALELCTAAQAVADNEHQRAFLTTLRASIAAAL